MISGERQMMWQKAARWPCGVCNKGVGSNSLQCTRCQKWVHKKCSGIKGSMSKVAKLFICRGCLNPVTRARRTSVDIGASAKLELVDKFCYLGDMLSVDWDADAAVEARISWNKFRLVLDRVCHFRPIPIHRFFAVNRIRYRYDTDFLIRFKSGRGAAWLTDQRLQTPPPQLITAVRHVHPLQRGGGCLWSVMDSQTQQLSVKFNINNINVSSQFFKSFRPTHCLVTY